MKPTWNAISREGLKMLAVSLDTLGLYARSADDLELLCNAFRLEDDTHPQVKPVSAMKIGICRSPAWGNETVTPSLEKVWAQAQDLLRAAGAQLVEIDLSPDFDGLFDVARTVMWCEARSAFLSDYLNSPELCHDDFKEHATNGKGLTRKAQLAAYDRLSRLKPVWDEIADKYDVSLFTGGLDTMLTAHRLFSHRVRPVKHPRAGLPQDQVRLIAVELPHVAD
jgi:Asp-tRNA(Asn)/Glu-tRNA(Gln) amidotransferase A subunit family amidase